MVNLRLVSSDNVSPKKKNLPFWRKQFKRLWEIVTQLRLCSSASCFGTHHAETLWKPSRLLLISCLEPWLMFRCCATSSIVDRRLSRIMAQTHSMFSSVVDVDGHPDRSSSATILRLFLNTVIKSYTPLWESTVPILCWKSAMDFCPRYTFSPQTSDHCTLLSFGANGQRNDHVNSLTTTTTDCSRMKLLHNGTDS